MAPETMRAAARICSRGTPSSRGSERGSADTAGRVGFEAHGATRLLAVWYCPGVYTAPRAVKKVPKQSSRPIATKRPCGDRRIAAVMGSKFIIDDSVSPTPHGNSRGYTSSPP
eukprot:6881707-Prymnesium_polylepis.1